MTPLSPLEFLSLIWPQKLLTHETLELRLINRKNQKIRREFFYSPQDLLKRASQSKDLDVYFGVSTRLGNEGKKKDCYRCKAVWVDLDGKDLDDCDFSTLPKSLRPTIAVKSGGGLHLYTILDSPILVRDERWLRIEAANRAMCKMLDGDIGAIDVTRILRVPGYLNTKYNPNRLVQAYAIH